MSPGDPNFERVWNAYASEAKKSFGPGAATERPEEMLLMFWPAGVHLWRFDGPLPGHKLAGDAEYRKRCRTFLNGRFRVAGEAFAPGHGWVEDALESVDEILGH
jgi:hypothetical protein